MVESLVRVVEQLHHAVERSVRVAEPPGGVVEAVRRAVENAWRLYSSCEWKRAEPRKTNRAKRGLSSLESVPWRVFLGECSLEATTWNPAPSESRKKFGVTEPLTAAR